VTDTLERLKTALADRYAIERELGQGGMATVYLARDLKHDRLVAIKVLRPELAATLGAERFLGEIRIAARLQHPYVLPLYDSGEAQGFLYYVMPFVEGESLRGRLVREGELPIQTVVRIVRDVAEALGYAHRQGVVHRDVKPDNVMFAEDHALVTDFGVAKAVSAAVSSPNITGGMALGTPTYMAPEQAAADPATDHRADIYALGAMAYEMLAGRPVFTAPSPQGVLAAHVAETPVPIAEHRPSVPPALADLVMRCLEKKPADRWQTADDLLQHLEPLVRRSGGTTPTQSRPTTASLRMPRWTKWAAWVAALAVVALAASQLVRPRPLTITASDITPVTSEQGVAFQPSISPDGNEVAYVAGQIGAPRLFVRSTVNVTSGAAVRLGDTAIGSDWFPRWTADGQSVRSWGCGASCAWRETGKLGGAVQTLTVPKGDRHAWSPDGARVAFVRADTIFTSSAAGTDARRLAVQPTRPAAMHSLAWSPDGRLIAYVNGNANWRTRANVAASSIWVVGAQGGEPQRVTENDHHLNVSPTWLDARHLLFVSDRDGQHGVYVVEVGPNGPRGAPRAVPGVADVHSISYSIASRRLAFAKLTLHQNIWAYPLGRTAPISIRDGRPVTTGTQIIETHDVSPDGKWIVFDGNLRGHMDLFKMPSGGGQAVPLTSGSVGGTFPRWSPNGREVVYQTAGAPDSQDIMLVSAEGGSPVAVTHGPRGHTPVWGPTGLEVAFGSCRSGRCSWWLVRRDTVGGAWHDERLLAELPCEWADRAPDGSGVVCASGVDLVFLSPQARVLWRRNFAATFESWGWSARYSRDGGTIYAVASGKDGQRGVWAIPAAGGTPRLVIAFDDPALPATGSLSVGPDRLYPVVSQYESNIWVAGLRW